MNRIILTIPVIILILKSCTYQQKRADTVKPTFDIPIVVQIPAKNTIELIKTDFLNDAYFEFFGKYKFTDTLHLGENQKRDTSYLKDFIWEYSKPRKNDSLTTDGFQIFVDYQTSIYYRDKYFNTSYYYFPVYVVNETSRTKVFIGKDNYVFGLQEAIDTSQRNQWKPIESKGFDFCGNGYFGLKIHPGEFAMFLVPKYEGDEEQLMRIRLQIGESIYLSRSYVGTFNSKQFNTKKDTWTYNLLRDRKSSAIQGMFYGATPKGYDDEW